ncbi:MAG: sodium-dependent transporter [Balneolaceae bacterium]|nr:sodium-dependent transporter [Balneolaceae bacterium]
MATAIMFYYSVVAGWCLYYLIASITAGLPETMTAANIVWEGFQGSMLPSVLHAMMIIGGGFIVAIQKGISSIERINKFLIPSLLLVVMVAMIRAITLPGSFQGIEYLFTPDWSTLSQPTVWIEALTQNAWDTGAAWGLILTYGAYMRTRDDVTISAFQTGIGNNIVSLFAAITIFSTVFGTLGSSMSNGEILNIMRDSGPAGTGLTFLCGCPSFSMRWSVDGELLRLFFPRSITLAAFSSLISMIELASRILVDMGILRSRATVAVCVTGFLFGLPSALSTNFLVNQDSVWGIGLLVSGAFMSFAIIKFDPTRFRNNLVNTKERKYTLGKWWEVVVKYVVPIEVVSLLVWWIYQSASVESWYNPISTFSLATVLLQWAIAMGLFYLYNDKLFKKSE